VLVMRYCDISFSEPECDISSFVIYSQSGQYQEHPDTVERPCLRAEISVEFRGGGHLVFKNYSYEVQTKHLDDHLSAIFALEEIYYCRDASLYELRDLRMSRQLLRHTKILPQRGFDEFQGHSSHHGSEPSMQTVQNAGSEATRVPRT
jgi:hypothetical protein